MSQSRVLRGQNLMPHKTNISTPSKALHEDLCAKASPPSALKHSQAVNWILNPSVLPLLEYHSPTCLQTAFFSHQLLCLTTIPHFWLRRSTKSSPLSFGSVPMITWQEAAWQWFDRHPPKETPHISHTADTLHTQRRSSTPGEISRCRQLLLIDYPKAADFPVSLTAEPGSTYLLWWSWWHCHAGWSQVCFSKAKQQVMSREDWSPISSPRTNLLKGNSTAKAIVSYLFQMIFMMCKESFQQNGNNFSSDFVFLKKIE